MIKKFFSKKPAASTAAKSPKAGKSKSRAALHDPQAAREAARYEHPIPSREAILALLESHAAPMLQSALADALGLLEDSQREALGKRLAAMLRDGQLLQNRRSGYAPAQKLDLIAGHVIANAEGFGFLRADAGGDDLYLAPVEMRKVLHGDRVLASVVGVDKRGRRQGAIVEVLERRSPRLVGRIARARGIATVVPDDKRLHQPVLIAAGQEMGAGDGQIVVAEITDPPDGTHGPIGRVVELLGEKLNASLIVRMAIAAHDLPQHWSAEVSAAAAATELQVNVAEHAGRADLRALPFVTIDGEDARDFDDAVHAVPLREGGFRLWVAIADVAHYVPIGSALDREAEARGTSVYFPGFVVPMLPEVLSNGICSLKPEVERLALVCEMRVDADGSVSRARFEHAIIRSHARLTYTQVWQALSDATGARQALGALWPAIADLHALYRVLAQARSTRGAIEFDSPEMQFRLDAKGEVQAMGAYERNDAHRLIEECMIAANVQAARFLERQRVPALYRVHDKPPAEKYADLLEFLREFKLRLPAWDAVTPKDFAHLLLRVRERPEALLLQSVLLRSQSLAVYKAANAGHFGLALDAYTHFTSPIRRYPDLLVHRAIGHALKQGQRGEYAYSIEAMATLAQHCSRRERVADEAEREVDERYQCAFMERHVGARYAGVITGVTSFGLFVEMVETRISGLVHVTQLPADFYHFEAQRRLLQGERSKRSYRLGDRVQVQVLRASLEDRKIDLRLVEGRD
jgi:ribonuclease R